VGIHGQDTSFACVCTVLHAWAPHLHLAFLPCRVKLWADTYGRDLYDTVTKYSGSLLLQKVSVPSWEAYSVVS
jgi:hypothetical protein